MPDPQQPDPIDKGNPITQQVQYSHVAARVPERGNRGAFATAVLVLTGNQELVCDFLLRMVPPYMLSARVILPFSALQPMVKAIAENLENFRSRFGAPLTPPPPPPNTPQPNNAEVYDQLKISDEVVVGAYANTLMISHTAGEFCMDFILDLFPKPVVTQRVYLSATQIPGFLGTLQRTLDQLLKRQQSPPPPQPPPEPPAAT
jgi:hypothetical protein